MFVYLVDSVSGGKLLQNAKKIGPDIGLPISESLSGYVEIFISPFGLHIKTKEKQSLSDLARIALTMNRKSGTNFQVVDCDGVVVRDPLAVLEGGCSLRSDKIPRGLEFKFISEEFVSDSHIEKHQIRRIEYVINGCVIKIEDVCSCLADTAVCQYDHGPWIKDLGPKKS